MLRLGCGYVTRPDNAHAKAGNINNALRLLERHERRPDFISILDADFVPKSKFLERAISLFHEPDVGVVQTPQHFINPDPIQNNLTAARASPDEQRFFFDIIMASKDAWSAAFCCGTSSLIRFDSLMAIGGFPTDSVTEDYLLTLRLKEIGYRTVYLNEPLSLGLAPEGIKEYITQRGRWCLGFMQIFRGRSGPFSGTTKLRFIDRLSLVENFLNWSAVYVLRMLGLIIPMLYLLFDIKAVRADLSDMLNQFLPYFIWHTATMAWVAQGRVMPFISDVCQLISAPVILKAVATGLLRPRGHKFKVTAKGGDRSRRFVEWPLVRLYGGLFIMSMVAISYFFHLHENASTSQYSVMALVWSWYNVIILLVTCCVCIDLPRYRKSERFETSDTITVLTEQGRRAYPLRDISITGARIRGAAPVPVGADLIVMLGDDPIGARVVRQDTSSFGVDFDPSPQARIAMIRHFYRGNYVQAIARGDAVAVGRAVLARVFR